MPTYDESINQLTRRYNEAIRNLEREYDAENSRSWMSTSSRKLKRQYSSRYQSLERDYRAECRQVLESCKQADPAWAKGRRLWARVFVAGIVALLGGCVFSLPTDDSAESPSTVMSQTEERYWNADNIPMPHLEDANQYVVNPDGVLSQQTVDMMNVTLKRLDDSLNVESVVIVVNHIENDDPFRMAQDVGNKYGVGRNDRGLLIVVGYEDHSINMSPGRALEADLTDAECRRLQQQYVIPAMRAELPDSGMLYLTEAVYSTLLQKALPEMTTLVGAHDQQDDGIATTTGIFMLLLIGWAMLFVRLNRKYQWLGLIGSVHLMANPFYEEPQSFSGGGGGGSFGGGGFSGGGGGSFGGGSFGGGGATSRW